MVRTRQPECAVTAHTLPANQNVLQGLIQCMTHMQLAGDVWGRNNDGVRFLCTVDLCMEAALVDPLGIDPVLEFFGGIVFCKFLCHKFQTPFHCVSGAIKYAPKHVVASGRITVVIRVTT